jgi:hypothetical protein
VRQQVRAIAKWSTARYGSREAVDQSARIRSAARQSGNGFSRDLLKA